MINLDSSRSGSCQGLLNELSKMKAGALRSLKASPHLRASASCSRSRSGAQNGSVETSNEAKQQEKYTETRHADLQAYAEGLRDENKARAEEWKAIVAELSELRGGPEPRDAPEIGRSST